MDWEGGNLKDKAGDAKIKSYGGGLREGGINARVVRFL